MWRSFFLACGVFIMLLGAQCLAVEKMVLNMKGDPPPRTSPWDNEPKPAPAVEWVPPQWFPWSFMSTGAVICLYSFTIPRRMGG